MIPVCLPAGFPAAAPEPENAAADAPGFRKYCRRCPADPEALPQMLPQKPRRIRPRDPHGLPGPGAEFFRTQTYLPAFCRESKFTKSD